jgi:hypothetical protein
MPKIIDIIYAPYLGTTPGDNNSTNEQTTTFDDTPAADPIPNANEYPKFSTTMDTDTLLRSVIWGYYKPNPVASNNNSTSFLEETDANASIKFVKVEVQSAKATNNGQEVFTTTYTYYCRENEYMRRTAPVFNKDIHNFVGTEQIRISDVLNGRSEFFPEEVRQDGTTIPAGYRWIGNSIVDKLMEFVNVNLDIQFKSGRLPADSYAQVYAASVQAVITAGIQFTIQKRQAESVIEKAESATEMQARQASAFTENNAIKVLEQLINLDTIAISTDAQELNSAYLPNFFGQVGKAGATDLQFGKDQRLTKIFAEILGHLNIKIKD